MSNIRWSCLLGAANDSGVTQRMTAKTHGPLKFADLIRLLNVQPRHITVSSQSGSRNLLTDFFLNEDWISDSSNDEWVVINLHNYFTIMSFHLFSTTWRECRSRPITYKCICLCHQLSVTFWVLSQFYHHISHAVLLLLRVGQLKNCLICKKPLEFRWYETLISPVSYL